MGQVIVRSLDDEVIRIHRARARARGVSLEQQLRDALTAAAKPSRAELLAEADAIRGRNRPPPPGGSWPTVLEMLREDRDRH